MIRLVALSLLLLAMGTAVPAVAQPYTGLPRPTRPVDLSTPRRAFSTYLDAARRRDWLRAAYVFDLRGYERHEQRERGRRIAQQLDTVLDQKLFVELDQLSDDPEGNPDDGPRLDRLGTIPTRDEDPDAAIELFRVQLADGTHGWVFSQDTVVAVGVLHQIYGPAWIESRLPKWMTTVRFLGVEPWQWIGFLVAALLAWLVGVVLGAILLKVVGRLVARTRISWDDELLREVGRPTRFTLALIAFYWVMQALHLGASAYDLTRKLWQVLVVIAVAWYLFRGIGFLARVLERRAMEGDPSDEIRRRGVRTQIIVLRRVAFFIIGVVTVALVLLQFDAVKNLGVSLLASASLAGVVIGFAAQRSLGTLLAGIQLSITQPIRIGDTVLIEGEYGQVEEITLTYVTVKLWDQRRLIVPMSSFLEKPFQNWTRVSPEMLGTVEVPASYDVDVDAVRAEVRRFVEASPLWDKRTVTVQMTDVDPTSVKLRALVSAEDPTKLWDLKCALREHLTKYLREEKRKLTEAHAGA